MRILLLTFSFLLLHCAFLPKPEIQYPAKFNGPLGYKSETENFVAYYSGGKIDSLLSLQTMDSLQLHADYERGKLKGDLIFQFKNGDKRLTHFNKIGEKDWPEESCIDSTGKSLEKVKEETINEKSFRKKFNYLYSMQTVSEIKNKSKEGWELVIARNGDTLCREEFKNGKKKSKTDRGCYRGIEEVNQVINEGKKALNAYYEKFTWEKKFNAKLTLQLLVNKEGKVEIIYPKALFCKNEIFIIEVLNKVSQWEFRAVKYPAPQYLTLPLVFHQEK